MAGTPPSRVDDSPPSADEIGNHHWPVVSNYFAGHGAKFLEHHHHETWVTERPILMRQIHTSTVTGAIHPDHDESAVYHKALEEPGCRSAPVEGIYSSDD